MRRRVCVLIAILINMYLIYAQKDIRIIPPSPNAASLGIYGDVPIGLYTGVPDISVPIYTIKCGSIELPISLKYHASGIKVAQEASCVGLGWSFNAGGVITRTVYGYDDFGSKNNVDADVAPEGFYYGYEFPYLTASKDMIDLSSGNPATIYMEYEYLRKHDTEPDVFCFNFSNYCGKFFFEKRTNNVDYAEPISESINDLKIKYFPSHIEGEGQSYGRWEITDGK